MASSQRVKTRAKKYEPKISTNEWVFYEDCLGDKKRQRTHNCGPHEAEWRAKFDVHPKPNKTIAASKPCLPRLDPIKPKSPDYGRDAVHTRFTRTQHERMKESNTVDEMELDAVYVQLKDSVVKDNHPLLHRKLNQYLSPSSSRQNQTQALIDIASMMNPGLLGKPKSPKADKRPPASQTRSIYDKQISRKAHSIIENDIESALAKHGNIYSHFKNTARNGNRGKAKKKVLENPWGNPDEIKLKESVDEFVEWAQCLSTKEPNLDYTKLYCLFSSGYDTSPAMPVPIVMMKRSEVPPNLQEIAVVPPYQAMSAMDAKKQNDKKKYPVCNRRRHKPMYRYGEWYLNPNTWTKRKAGEQLKDPKDLETLEDVSEMEFTKRSKAYDLSSLYISNAFSEYLSSRRRRQPEFLVEAQKGKPTDRPSSIQK